MILTNKQGMPDAFVKAVTLEPHNKEGEYSATTLLKGACETLLTSRHFDEIEVDVSDMVWAIWGQAVHAIFEKQSDAGFKEERFEVPVLNSKVTGRVDLYDMENEVLYDWKTASVWKVKFNDFDDWKKQGLIYAWLMKKHGLNVKRCEFWALLKDHSKAEARRNSDYPFSPACKFAFDVTEKELAEIEKFIFEKIEQLEKAETVADEELSECSKDERWATDDTFAVMKEGRKTAVRVFEKKEDAETMLNSLDDKHWMQERKGESKKCIDYCNCKNFCPFYKKMTNL